MFKGSNPAPGPPDLDAANITAVFLINMTTYSPSKSSKIKKKDKISRLKEANLTVAPTSQGYIQFLHALLETHNLDEYKIMDKKAYSFKYLYPPSKLPVYVMSQCFLSVTLTQPTPC